MQTLMFLAMLFNNPSEQIDRMEEEKICWYLEECEKCNLFRKEERMGEVAMKEDNGVACLL